MARYNMHPAQESGHYHNEKLYKDRRPTLDQIKEQQRLKKLKKKRRKGEIKWQYTKVKVLAQS